MPASMRPLLLAFLCFLPLGCATNIGASYWIPSFSNSTQSGPTSQMVDITQTFGVNADSGVFVYHVQGQAGSQRGRAGYWRIKGAGTSTIAGSDVDFANHTYLVGDQTSTIMDLSMIEASWEPGIINRPKSRFGLLLGVELIKFNLIADDITNPPAAGDGEVHIPTSDMDFLGIGFMPVPVFGASFDYEFNHWIGLTTRGQYFDTDLVGGLGLSGTAMFWGIESGLVIGDAKKHVQGFAGYRFLHAEYSYTDDAGDSDLHGFTCSVMAVF